MNDIKLTRHELYDKVWERPMTKVAPELGLSDVGLAKVCRKYEIPRPPVGYWAKLAHGKTVERTALPPLDEEGLSEVIAFREHFDRDDPVAKRPKIVVEVPERLSAPHPLVRQAKDMLKSAKAEENGIVEAGKNYLAINVSRKSIPRALKIFDAVIKAWEKEGGSVSVDPTSFCLGKNSVSVTLTGTVKRYEKKPTERRYWYDYRYEPTGKLSLEIDRYGDGLRKSWKDGKVQTVESVLGNFISSLHDWMEYLDGKRLDSECEARQEKKAHQRRASVKEKAELEQARRDELMSFVESWEKAERIRKYLSFVEDAIDSKSVAPPNPEKFGLWLECAHWYADAICPITPTRPRESSVEVPENLPIKDVEFTRETKSVIELLPCENTDELFEMERDELKSYAGDKIWRVWREVNLVFEGLGYNVSDRETKYW